MKIVKILGIILILLIAGLFAVASQLPEVLVMERSTTTKHNKAMVFAVLSDYRKFNKWSPWHKIDPKTQYSFAGPPTGVGSKMSWQSDHQQVGNGFQEIVAIEGQDYIKIKLQFGEDESESYYRLEDTGDGTKITWGFKADFQDSLIGRYFGLMIEGMLGPQYEEGLANLNQYLDKSSK